MTGNPPCAIAHTMDTASRDRLESAIALVRKRAAEESRVAGERALAQQLLRHGAQRIAAGWPTSVAGVTFSIDGSADELGGVPRQYLARLSASLVVEVFDAVTGAAVCRSQAGQLRLTPG